jgi:hypothetical protein
LKSSLKSSATYSRYFKKVVIESQPWPIVAKKNMEVKLPNWRLLTANEAYPLCGYRTVKAFRLAAQNGLIPRVVIGKTVRFDLDAIREWAKKGGTPLKAENEAAQKPDHSLAATV